MSTNSQKKIHYPLLFRFPVLSAAATALILQGISIATNQLSAHSTNSTTVLAGFCFHTLALTTLFTAIRISLRKYTLSKNIQAFKQAHLTYQLQQVSIYGLARITEARDPDTGNHLNRMGRYSRLIAEACGEQEVYRSYISRNYCEDIFVSAPLHDIGKVAIKDNVLVKRGPLSEEEFELMKMHTIIGGNLLHELEKKVAHQNFYTLSKQIAFHHHQRWDGLGYPNVYEEDILFVEPGIGRPLKGEQIPLSARIVAIADVYDALCSKRCYKEALPHHIVREIMLSESGKHFDPLLLDLFFSRESQVLSIAQSYPH